MVERQIVALNVARSIRVNLPQLRYVRMKGVELARFTEPGGKTG